MHEETYQKQNCRKENMFVSRLQNRSNDLELAGPNIIVQNLQQSIFSKSEQDTANGKLELLSCYAAREVRKLKVS